LEINKGFLKTHGGIWTSSCFHDLIEKLLSCLYFTMLGRYFGMFFEIHCVLNLEYVFVL